MEQRNYNYNRIVVKFLSLFVINWFNSKVKSVRLFSRSIQYAISLFDAQQSFMEF